MAKSGQWGIQTSLGAGSQTSSTIGLKFMASENLAVRVEAGFTSFSPGGGGSTSSGYGFGAGFEYHMTAVGGVSPYVGLGAGYNGVSIGGAANNPSTFNVLGFWGGEYFFSSNFSWAGQIGLGFNSFSPGGGGNSQTTIGTTSLATTLTWYMN
ncbi:MAG TPA: hypothetical protein VL633_01665 [Bacteroidota bacterium]|nr:hypothetical protein [Bacteroidota bacterium]